MSKEEKTSLVLKKETDYQMMQYDNVTAELFQKIREKLHLEPALGECMFVKGKFYVTHPGCSRLAEQKEVKSIQYEYLDPSTFPLPQIRKNPENFIIVKCILTKKDGGVIDGLRILDLESERKIGFPFKCEFCGNESKYGKKKDKWTKICKCGNEIKGFDMWLIKDYVNFAETKAFMRAVGKAYSVEIFDDLPEDVQNEAKDLVSEYEKTKEIKKDIVKESKPEPMFYSDPVREGAPIPDKKPEPQTNGNGKIKVWDSFDVNNNKILAAEVFVERVTDRGGILLKGLGWFNKSHLTTRINKEDEGKKIGIGFTRNGIDKLKKECADKIQYDESHIPDEEDIEIIKTWDEIIPKDQVAQFEIDFMEAENNGDTRNRDEFAIEWITKHKRF